MSSGTSIIQSALSRIGAHSVISPASPESVETGREVLNSLLESWRSKLIDMGTVPLGAAGDELSEPMDARQAIIDNLAVTLAPNFDNGKLVVSQDLRRLANMGMQTIRALYQKIEVPTKKVSSTMPLGVGGTRGIRRASFISGDRGIDG